MALSQLVLAQRIKDALDGSGMSQRMLAEYVEMDETALSKALSGRRNFRSLEVARIAERLGLRTDVLFADEEQGEDRAALAARVQDRTTERSAVADAVGIAEQLTELDRLLADVGHPAEQVPSLPALGRRDAVKQGETLASALRNQAGIRDALLPRSIEGLARWMENEFGLDVCITPLPVGVDGLALTSGDLRLITVSSNISATRQRFTMAHELCHVVSGDAQDLTIDEDVYARQSREERRANAFAAALLIPASALRSSTVGHHMDLDLVVQLLGDFGVSLDMLAYRLHNVGIVSTGDRDSIRAMNSARIAARPGRSDDLQARNERRAPARLLDRALNAFAVGHLGIRPLAKLLNVDPDQLREELTPPRFRPWPATADVVPAL